MVTILFVNTGIIFINTVMLGVLTIILKELVYNENKHH